MVVHTVSIRQAKSRLSELIREAEEGAEVIVVRNGRPVARIIPWPSARPVRVPGVWAGQVGYDEDVVGSDDEVVALFDASAESELP